MVDAELRALERRWRVTLDPLDRGRWLRELVRAGRLAAERVWAGEALGHTAATEAARGLSPPTRALDQRLPRTFVRQTIAARLLVVPLPGEPLALGALQGWLGRQACAQAVHLLGRAAAAAGCRRVVLDVEHAELPERGADDAALLAGWGLALRRLGGWLALARPTPTVVAWFAERAGVGQSPLGHVAPERVAEALVTGLAPADLDPFVTSLSSSS